LDDGSINDPRISRREAPVAAVRKPGRSAARLPRKAPEHEDAARRILDAALDCFGAFGFEGTSTRAVADRAHVTHTLVHYYFRSKEQLWTAAMADVLTRYRTEMIEHLEASADRSAAAILRIFIEQFVRMSARSPQVHRIMTAESNEGTPRLQAIIDEQLRDHFVMIRDLIRRGQEEGAVRDCDPARLYFLILGAAGTPYTTSTEYKALTGRDVSSPAEILKNVAFIYEIVFI
jgi:TetR/AcrR family transcriptional regulator